MVGMLKTRWAVRATGLLNSAKFSGDIAFKLEQLRMLREVLLNSDPSLLPEFAPRLTKLDAGLPAAARKLIVDKFYGLNGYGEVIGHFKLSEYIEGERTKWVVACKRKGFESKANEREEED